MLLKVVSGVVPGICFAGLALGLAICRGLSNVTTERLESFPSFNFSDIFWRTSVTEIVDIPANRLRNQENTISDVVSVDNEDRINDPVIENNIRLNDDQLVHINPREVKRKKSHFYKTNIQN